MVTNTSKVVASQEQVASEVAGDVTILNLKNGTYYGLSDVGATVWQLLSEPRHVTELVDRVVAEYEVEAAQCQWDVLELLSNLEQEGLIDILK
jgi:DNA integrity scanning protein DisA with diadenylate cyclase activity